MLHVHHLDSNHLKHSRSSSSLKTFVGQHLLKSSIHSCLFFPAVLHFLPRYIPPNEDEENDSSKVSHHDLDLLRRDYTLVLKGHIALGTAVFPDQTPGAALDALARMPLWKQGWNYNHGTGHGVGAHLNVHEGPHGIPWLRPTLVNGRKELLENGLTSGMIVSNEPGFYIEDHYGIRIENLVEVVDVQNESMKGGPKNMNTVEDVKEDKNSCPEFKLDEKHPYYTRDLKYCTFRNLTFVPLDKRLINVEMLSEEERNYVDNYHAQCYTKLSPFFLSVNTEEDDAFSLSRLKEWCAPLEDLKDAHHSKRRRIDS